MGIAMTQRKSSDIVMLLDGVDLCETNRAVGVLLEAPESLIKVTTGRPL